MECVPEHDELDTWIKNILPESAFNILNASLKLENEHIYCTKEIVYDTGAYIGTVYLAIIALLVLSGKHWNFVSCGFGNLVYNS